MTTPRNITIAVKVTQPVAAALNLRAEESSSTTSTVIHDILLEWLTAEGLMPLTIDDL